MANGTIDTKTVFASINLGSCPIIELYYTSLQGFAFRPPEVMAFI